MKSHFNTLLGSLLLLNFGFLMALWVFTANLSITTGFATDYWPSIEYRKVIILKNQIVYGYSSEVSQTDSDPFTTASGRKVMDGFIANNCRLFGQKIRMAGEIYEVADRMNRRYGCDVWDRWFESTEEARTWGKRMINIEIYEK